MMLSRIIFYMIFAFFFIFADKIMYEVQFYIYICNFITKFKSIVILHRC